jgi:hypothetical protein
MKRANVILAMARTFGSNSPTFRNFLASAPVKEMGDSPPTSYGSPATRALPEPAGPRRQQGPAMTPTRTTPDGIDYADPKFNAFPGMSQGEIEALPKAERDARDAAAQQAIEDAVHQQLEQGGAAAAKAFLDGLAAFGVLRTSHDPGSLGDVVRAGGRVTASADGRGRAKLNIERRSAKLGPHIERDGSLRIHACTPAEYSAYRKRMIASGQWTLSSDGSVTKRGGK